MKTPMERGAAFRPPTAEEKAILDLLLEDEFPGRDVLRLQAQACQVRTIDEMGSIECDVRGNVLALTEQSVPIEAEAEDEDGTLWHALLHVKEGKLGELEFYKEGIETNSGKPSLPAWRVVRYPPPPKRGR